jgi:hypothetical protein
MTGEEAGMTHLEMTKLCAEAMGLKTTVADYAHAGYGISGTYVQLSSEHRGDGPNSDVYNPLHDDAQAMALVKRFRLHPVYDADDRVWHCVTIQHGFYGRDPDLNRAIVECVAKMQATSTAKPANHPDIERAVQTKRLL